jgi:hypothetical protein
LDKIRVLILDLLGAPDTIRLIPKDLQGKRDATGGEKSEVRLNDVFKPISLQNFDSNGENHVREIFTSDKKRDVLLTKSGNFCSRSRPKTCRLR